MGILIKGGTVVSATESKPMDVLISGEMIARVGAGINETGLCPETWAERVASVKA